MEDMVIIGAGSSGLVILQILIAINSRGQKYNLLGFIDKAEKEEGMLENIPVLGKRDWLLSHKRIASVVSIGTPQFRKEISEYLENNGYKNYVNLIHPTSVMNKRIKMGRGIVIHPGVMIDPLVRLDDHVFLNKGVSIGHDVDIQRYCVLSPNVSLGGNVKLGEGVFMGMNSCILPNKTIGPHSIIGAGSVVTQDIDPYSVVAGVPGKVIRKNKPETI